VHIVCEDQLKGDEVALHMQNAGVKGDYFTQYQGFTDFVVRGKAESFLKL
jgi:hypothetical protein